MGGTADGGQCVDVVRIGSERRRLRLDRGQDFAGLLEEDLEQFGIDGLVCRLRELQGFGGRGGDFGDARREPGNGSLEAGFEDVSGLQGAEDGPGGLAQLLVGD